MEGDRIEKQQREIEEARQQRESNPTRMMKTRRLFSSRKPSDSIPSSDFSSRLRRDSYASIDEDENISMSDHTSKEPQSGRLARVGSAIAAPFRWIGNQFSRSKQHSKIELSNHAFSPLSSADDSGDVMDSPSSSLQGSRRLLRGNALYACYSPSSSPAARPNSSMNSSRHGLNTANGLDLEDGGATLSTFVGQSSHTHRRHQPQYYSTQSQASSLTDEPAVLNLTQHGGMHSTSDFQLSSRHVTYWHSSRLI